MYTIKDVADKMDVSEHTLRFGLNRVSFLY